MAFIKMREELQKLLQEEPSLARLDIVKRTGFNKSAVSKLLHEKSDLFRQSDNYCWYLKNTTSLEIDFDTNCWLTSNSFEKTLSLKGSPLTETNNIVVFTFPKGCKILLEAIARILALCNQLALKNKTVILKFKSSYGYLDRIGFFELLNEKVVVRPERPKIFKSQIYKENNKSTVEFGEICLNSPNNNIPEQLKNSFISNAGNEYSKPAFTILGELFDNVVNHSNSPIPGFTALQLYEKSINPHLQTVISDSGEGIIGTLRPVIGDKYKDLDKKYDLTKADDCISLILEIFEKGKISRHGKESGAGLKASAEMAAKYNAQISVRQDNFEVKLFYKEGKFHDFLAIKNMPLIKGTHICFDFFLTK